MRNLMRNIIRRMFADYKEPTAQANEYPSTKDEREKELEKIFVKFNCNTPGYADYGFNLSDEQYNRLLWLHSIEKIEDLYNYSEEQFQTMFNIVRECTSYPVSIWKNADRSIISGEILKLIVKYRENKEQEYIKDTPNRLMRELILEVKKLNITIKDYKTKQTIIKKKK